MKITQTCERDGRRDGVKRRQQNQWAHRKLHEQCMDTRSLKKNCSLLRFVYDCWRYTNWIDWLNLSATILQAEILPRDVTSDNIIGTHQRKIKIKILDFSMKKYNLSEFLYWFCLIFVAHQNSIAMHCSATYLSPATSECPPVRSSVAQGLCHKVKTFWRYVYSFRQNTRTWPTYGHIRWHRPRLCKIAIFDQYIALSRKWYKRRLFY